MSNSLRTAVMAVSLIVLAGCGQAPTSTHTSVASVAPRLQASETIRPHVPNQVLVKFKPTVAMTSGAIAAFASSYGTREIGSIAGIGVHVMQIVDRTPVATMVTRMTASPVVEYAEPNYEVGIGLK